MSLMNGIGKTRAKVHHTDLITRGKSGFIYEKTKMSSEKTCDISELDYLTWNFHPWKIISTHLR